LEEVLDLSFDRLLMMMMMTVSYLDVVGRIVAKEYNVKIFWYLSLQNSDTCFFLKKLINMVCHMIKLSHKC
jgi:hypothetical protein